MTRHVAEMATGHHGFELGKLLNAVREGAEVNFDLSDTDGSAPVRHVIVVV